MSIDNEEPGNAVEGGERSTQEQLNSDQQRDPRPLSQQSTLVGTPSDLGAAGTDYQNDFSFASTGSDIPDRQPPLPFDLPPTSSLPGASYLEVTNLSQPYAEPSQMDQNRASQELVEDRPAWEPSTLDPGNREAALQDDWPHSRQPTSGRSTPEINLSQATDVEVGFDEAPPRQSDGPDRPSQAPSPTELISSVAFDDDTSVGGAVRTSVEGQSRRLHAEPTSEEDLEPEINFSLREQSPVTVISGRDVETYRQTDSPLNSNRDSPATTRRIVDNEFGRRHSDQGRSNLDNPDTADVRPKRSRSSSEPPEPPPPAKRPKLRGDDSRKLNERARSHSR